MSFYIMSYKILFNYVLELKDLDPSECVNPCNYKLDGRVYYTNTAAVSADDVKDAVLEYLTTKLSAEDYFLKPKSLSITIAEGDTEINGQNMNHVHQSGYALYWVPPLLAIIFVGTVLYFIRENKSKVTNHRHSLDEGGEDSIDSDLVYKKGYGETVTSSASTRRPSNPMTSSSPMLVFKTKKSSLKQGNDTRSSLKYNPLECTDTSFDIFPLKDIDTNVKDFALGKRTPTKVLVSTNESYNMYPVQYDENTSSSTVDMTMTESSKKTRSASKRNGYSYRESTGIDNVDCIDGVNGKDKLLHEWDLEYIGRHFQDTLEL